MEDLLSRAASAAARYLEGLDERRVTPTDEAIRHLSELNEPLPEQPTSAEAVLEMLDRIGSPATVATAGGRFFGFVVGGCLPAALAANWLAGAWDQIAGLYVATPIGATLEEVSLRWLLDVLRLPPECGGAFVTGATMASFTALAAARHAVLEQAGWDVEAKGLVGAPPIAIVLSEDAHPSVLKALGLLGLGRETALRVPVDGQGRMRPDAFPSWRGPAIVCMQCGNVNSGAFDPAAEICAIARERGAFGLWAAASPAYAHLVAGVAGADSWATDAHKWLNVPYDSGLAFVRQARDLNRAMSLAAAYLPQSEHREPSQFVPELSRRARGIEIWAVLRSLGRAGLADLIERTCGHARRFAEGLRAAGYEILNEVVLNQVLVAFGDAAATRLVIGRIQREGVCWCGETNWQGRVAMRISVCSWATTDRDVERSLTSMLAAAKA